MTVEIKRCFFWADIKAEAVSLKNDLERNLGMPVRLRAGAPGSLRVLVDGDQIYSMKEAGRPLNVAELVKSVRERGKIGCAWHSPASPREPWAPSRLPGSSGDFVRIQCLRPMIFAAMAWIQTITGKRILGSLPAVWYPAWGIYKIELETSPIDFPILQIPIEWELDRRPTATPDQVWLPPQTARKPLTCAAVAG